MRDDSFKFMDLVKVVRDSDPGIINLDAATIGLVDFYEGAMGRIVGNKGGQTWTVWFPIPGYPEPKPQLGTFSPRNLEMMKRPSEAEFNTMAYPFPLDK